VTQLFSGWSPTDWYREAKKGNFCFLIWRPLESRISLTSAKGPKRTHELSQHPDATFGYWYSKVVDKLWKRLAIPLEKFFYCRNTVFIFN